MLRNVSRRSVIVHVEVKNGRIVFYRLFRGAAPVNICGRHGDTTCPRSGGCWLEVIKSGPGEDLCVTFEDKWIDLFCETEFDSIFDMQYSKSLPVRL